MQTHMLRTLVPQCLSADGFVSVPAFVSQWLSIPGCIRNVSPLFLCLCVQSFLFVLVVSLPVSDAALPDEMHFSLPLSSHPLRRLMMSLVSKIFLFVP